MVPDDELKQAAPAYLKIIADLKKRINSGEYTPGMVILSEREMCDRYKVSRITARRALDELANEGWVERIQGKGSFVRRPQKQPSAAKQIALVVDGIYDFGTLPIILRGVEREANRLGFQVAFFNSECRFDKCREIAHSVIQGGFDGVIIDPIQSDEDYERNLELIDELERHRIPVVLIQKYLFNHPDRYSYVISDNYSGAFLLVEHLVNVGHRRIAFIHDSFNSGIFARYQGYQSALLEHDLEIDNRLIREIQDIKEIDGTVDRFLNEVKEPPTALFCGNDLMAFEVLRLMREKKIKVPEDVSVVGFDNLPGSSIASVGLTTVSQQLEAMGIKAVKAVKHRSSGHFDDKVQFVLPCELVVRESCGVHLKELRIASGT